MKDLCLIMFVFFLFWCWNTLAEWPSLPLVVCQYPCPSTINYTCTHAHKHMQCAEPGDILCPRHINYPWHISCEQTAAVCNSESEMSSTVYFLTMLLSTYLSLLCSLSRIMLELILWHLMFAKWANGHVKWLINNMLLLQFVCGAWTISGTITSTTPLKLALAGVFHC